MAHAFLEKYMHQKRLLFIFCKSKDDSNYNWQEKELQQFAKQLELRRVKVVYVFTSEPAGTSEPDLDQEDVPQLLKEFDVSTGGFAALLLDTSGNEKFRDNRPVAAQTLVHIIDVMPSRKEEQGG